METCSRYMNNKYLILILYYLKFLKEPNIFQSLIWRILSRVKPILNHHGICQPHDSPSLGNKLPRLQGCDSSPGHQGLRGIESASFAVYSVFILSFEPSALIQTLSHFFLVVYVFLILSGRGCLYILEMNSLCSCFIFYFLWYSSAFKANQSLFLICSLLFIILRYGSTKNLL